MEELIDLGDYGDQEEGSLLNPLNNFIQLLNEQDYLKKELEKVKAKIAQQQDSIITLMQDNHLQRYTAHSRTISIRREVWASHEGEDKEDLLKALEVAGLGTYVQRTYNTMSLSAYVRELDPDGALSAEEIIQKLPEQIRPFIKVSEVIKINNRRA